MLPPTINDDQKGFLKDSYIGENIRHIGIHRKTLCSRRAVVDFEKAFDSFLLKQF